MWQDGMLALLTRYCSDATVPKCPKYYFCLSLPLSWPCLSVSSFSICLFSFATNSLQGLLFETTSQFSLSDGTESLLRAILGECTLHGASSGLAGPIPAPVRFGRVVSHVTQEKGGTCSVTCTNGESVSARSVVIAVP